MYVYSIDSNTTFTEQDIDLTWIHIHMRKINDRLQTELDAITTNEIEPFYLNSDNDIRIIDDHISN